MLVEGSGGNGGEKMLSASLDESKGIYIFPWIFFLSLLFFRLECLEGAFCWLFLLTRFLLVIFPITADLLASESSMPLSPQWLYAKPAESKMVGAF